jgi:hypothetical protein
MSGRLENAEFDTSDIKRVAIIDGNVWKRNSGFAAEDDLGTGAFGEFAMAADEVSVEMSLNHVLDLETLLASLRDVLKDIALRVDDCSLTC